MRALRTALIATLSLGFLFLAGLWAPAQTQTPVGSWDVLLGGSHQRGLAHVNFFPDGTLDGFTVFAINGNRFSRTNGGFVYRHIFGSAQIQGAWLQDGPGRIIGYLNLIAEGEGGMLTNGFSIRGKVRPTRFNLLAHGSAAKMTLKGIPLAETNLVELSGTNYLGRARIRNVPFPLIEIFTPTLVEPNIYAITGGGPGYDYTGTLLISRQRQAAFYQDRGADVAGSTLGAYVGPFNAVRRRGNLKGTDGVNMGIRYRFEPGAP